MKRWIAPALLLICAATHATENTAGFVTINPEGEAKFYFPEHAVTHQFIHFQWMNERGEVVCCKKIGRGALKRVDADEERVLDLGDPDQGFASAYISTEKVSGPPHGVFVGMAASTEKLIAKGSNRIRAETKRVVMEARLCYVKEGANLIARERDAYRVLYMGFDYQIDQLPRCGRRDRQVITGQGQ